MEIEIRAVIHFLWLKQYRNPDIFSKLEDVYDMGVTTLQTVESWTKAFTEERTTLNDSPTPGRPSRNHVTDAVK
jgi:transposase